MSILVMSLTPSPQNYKQVKDYMKLVGLTNNGVYVNTVSKMNAPHVMQRFFSLMDVYPTDKIPVIQEFFKIL